ncbi:PIG-L family deacetylase [Candidatus Roizmanbacteria bacterium]|nr:PIG-L family deacetylase [Candidatus Roizmanbacteria bacterium]
MIGPKQKRKVVVGVFAHPDDEAFGPGGSLAKFAKTDDVYVICATRGEAGMNHQPEKNVKLSAIRENELLESAKILGVKKVYFLDFADGTLCNNLYHQLAEKIELLLRRLRPEILITFEPRGISGHIDHVTISLVTTFVFEKLSFIKKLLYYCIVEKQRQRLTNYFIYFPPGYRLTEVDFVNDVAEEWATKVKAMFTHASQIKDVKRILKRHQGLPKHEHFLMKVK